jgi:putative ABC transport system substrate-binding protein
VWGWRDTAAAAQALGVQLDSLEVRALDDFDRVAAALTRQRPDGLLIPGGTLFGAGLSRRIIALAAQQALPAMYPVNTFVREGGLMAYGVDLFGLHRRAARYVDRILKGTSPADLPVEEPHEFQLAVNRNTAQALGLAIPEAILSQATEIIA